MYLTNYPQASLPQIKCFLLPVICGWGIWSELRRVVLAGGVSCTCSQDISWVRPALLTVSDCPQWVSQDDHVETPEPWGSHNGTSVVICWSRQPGAQQIEEDGPTLHLWTGSVPRQLSPFRAAMPWVVTPRPKPAEVFWLQEQPSCFNG